MRAFHSQGLASVPRERGQHRSQGGGIRAWAGEGDRVQLCPFASMTQTFGDDAPRLFLVNK